MKDVYRGREQTYLKHFLLQHYLERVGYVVGSTFGSLVYIDAFSGPWKAADPAFDDTSFMIAIKTLRKVRSDLAERGSKPPSIRCVFVEKDPESFSKLKTALKAVDDIEVKLIPGAFEDSIPEIKHFVGRTFALTFIDPTGWTGFGLERIESILKHKPGEILITYMTDFINRFGGLPEHSNTFTEMMGGTGFEGLEEEQRVAFYCDQIRRAGSFEFVTSTRIMKSTADRTYFHLIYGTRNIKGLCEFRDVERKEIEVQEKIRIEAKELNRVMRTKQDSLFPMSELDPSLSAFEAAFLKSKGKAKSRLMMLLDRDRKVEFEQILGSLLEIPLVWESSVKQIVKELCDDGYAQILGLQGRQKVMRKGCSLVRIV